MSTPLTGRGRDRSPDLDWSISVLKPGEYNTRIRQNASQVNFCSRGGGEATVDGKTIQYGQYDVFNTPSWVVYEHRNNTSDLQVRLTYSNSPLLEKMKVHIVEEEPRLDGPKKRTYDEHSSAD